MVYLLISNCCDCWVEGYGSETLVCQSSVSYPVVIVKFSWIVEIIYLLMTIINLDYSGKYILLYVG